jgi:exopolysaccharide biosynthesis protein
LLLNGTVQPFENNNWNYVRNPRTGVCIMDDNIIKLVTVDGRFYTSAGMTLPEFQTFLTMIGCKSAINLDGGGSTTMYVEKFGVINEPRDKPPPGVVGYNNFVTLRKISNAIVVL